MKTIIYFLVTGMLFLHIGQYANAQTGVCGGASMTVEQSFGGQVFSASSKSEGLEKYSEMILLNTPATCPKCPKPNDAPCELAWDDWVTRPTGGTQETDSTYSFNPSTVKYKVKCLDCDQTSLSVFPTDDPLYGTLALCDGVPHQVIVDIPGVHIFNLDGIPLTPQEAKDRWVTMIILDNGNNIEGSEPWGCTISECAAQGMEGCNMTINEFESQLVPEPEPDPETGGWRFDPTPYQMSYSCSPCGPPGGQRLKAPTFESKAEGAEGIIEKMYPNPSYDQLNLMLDLTAEKATIAIVDLSGKTLKSYQVSIPNGNKGLISINVSDLPVGIYQLSVTTGEDVSSRKFSVNR